MQQSAVAQVVPPPDISLVSDGTGRPVTHRIGTGIDTHQHAEPYTSDKYEAALVKAARICYSGSADESERGASRSHFDGQRGSQTKTRSSLCIRETSAALVRNGSADGFGPEWDVPVGAMLVVFRWKPQRAKCLALRGMTTCFQGRKPAMRLGNRTTPLFMEIASIMRDRVSARRGERALENQRATYAWPPDFHGLQTWIARPTSIVRSIARKPALTDTLKTVTMGMRTPVEASTWPKRSAQHRPRGRRRKQCDVVMLNSTGRPQLDAALSHYSGSAC